MAITPALTGIQQGDITSKYTKHGTFYSIVNLSTLGNQYYWIDLANQEYEILQVSCQIASEPYAHYGTLFVQWESDDGSILTHFLKANYFTQLEPFHIGKSIKVIGPGKLMFQTFQDGNNLGYCNMIVRPVQSQVGGFKLG